MLIEYKVATSCQLALENGTPHGCVHDDRASDQILLVMKRSVAVGRQSDLLPRFLLLLLCRMTWGEAPSTALHETETKCENNVVH